MAGGPSHLETFDYKPELAELDGKPMPAVVHRKGNRSRSCRAKNSSAWDR